jgi:hypothetical protein
MSKKNENQENKAVETQNEKFKRIANFRIKKLRYELNRIVNMASQPTYEIFNVDAQKILDKLAPEFENLLSLYQKIANNENIKSAKKEDFEDVF